MPSSFLGELILITTAAFVGGFVARTVKLPPVLGYIVSGVVFGIVGRSFFESYDSILAISQLGISLLLFTLGFEISLDVLRKISKRVIIVGVLQIFLVALVSFPMLSFFGIELRVAILLSIIFSFSSTAVVVKLLEESGLINDFPGNNVFVYLLIQDLFIVPIIFLLPIIFTKGQITPSVILTLAIALIKPLVIFMAIFLLGQLFLSRLIRFLFRYPSHELTILATIFTASVSILLLSGVGLPQTIAAFLAGVLISEQGKNLAPLAEIRPFRDLFLVLFFVLTGMLLDFNFFIHNIPFILAITVSILVIKFIVIYLVLRLSKHSPGVSVFISSYLANIGEFAIVIGQIALIALFITPREYNLILSIFVLCLLLIPVWTRYSRVIGDKLTRFKLLGDPLKDKDLAPDIEIKRYKKHVVICGQGKVGREARAMLELANIPYIVIDFNKKVISDLVAASKFAIYGDPTDEDTLRAASIEDARVLVIALPDTFSQKRIINFALKMNPKIRILCRSHVEADKYDLINLGVSAIVMPELEAGIRMGEEVLELFEVKQDEIRSHFL